MFFVCSNILKRKKRTKKISFSLHTKAYHNFSGACMFSMVHWKKETEHKEIGHWYRTKLTDSIMLVGIDENSYNCATSTIDLGDRFFWLMLKFSFSEKATNTCVIFLMVFDVYKANLEEDCNFLWPSQKSWTLAI